MRAFALPAVDGATMNSGWLALPTEPPDHMSEKNIAAVLRVHHGGAVAHNGVGFHHVAKADDIEDSRWAIESQVRSDGTFKNGGVELEIHRRDGQGIGQAVDIDGASGEVQAVHFEAAGNLRVIAGGHRRAGVGELQAGRSAKAGGPVLAIPAIYEIVEAALENQRAAKTVVSVNVDVVQNEPSRSAAVGTAVGEDGSLLHASGSEQHAAEVHATHTVDLRDQEHRVGVTQKLRAVNVGKTGGLMRLAFDVDRSTQNPGLINEDEIVVGMNFDAVGESVGQAVGQIQCGIEGNVNHAIGDVNGAATDVVSGLNRSFQVCGIVVQNRDVGNRARRCVGQGQAGATRAGDDGGGEISGLRAARRC